MKKLQVLILVLLFSLSICAFTNIQVKADDLSVGPAVASASPIDIGETSGLSVTVSGGTSDGFSFQWMIEAPGSNVFSDVSDATGQTYGFLATAAGVYQFEVLVTDLGDPSDQLNSTAISVTVNPALVAPTSSASPTTIATGQNSALSITAVSTGTSPYTYQWYSKVASGSYAQITGATLPSYTFTASTTGDWTFQVQVTDATEAAVNSTAATITVDAAPAAVVSPAFWAMDVGQNKTFTAIPSGGSGSYASYQWYVDSVLQSGQVDSTFNYSSTSAGTRLITVTVTDSLGAISPQSGPANITVNSALVAPAVSASQVSVDQGQTFALNSTAVTSGTSPYVYEWLQKAPNSISYSAITGATSANYTYVTLTSTTAGSWSFELQVTDNAGSQVAVNSTAVSVTVFADPAVSVSPASVTLNVGQSQTFSANATGGSGSYSSYQWYVNGTGQSGQTAATFSYSPTASGTYQITVTVADSLNETSALSAPATASVNTAPTATVSPTSWTMDLGQNKTFTASPAGGSGSYKSYQWYVNSVLQSGQVNSTFIYVPSSAGTYSITVTVTDSLNSTSPQSAAASVTVAASPTVSIAPAGPITMDAGQSQTFAATASGGSGTLSYQWYIDGGAVGSNSASYSYTASAGTHSVTCKVTDSASTPVTSPASNTVSVTVNPTLAPPTVTPSPSTVNQGQTCSLTSSTVTTGTSPYTYQWFERAPGGSYVTAGSNSATFSFATSNVTATGSWSFILQVKDNTGVSVNSSAVSVTVNASLLNQFVFSSISTQTAGTSFSITITAKDAYGDTITNYTGTNTLTVSTGTITPTSSGAFKNGVWTGSVTVTGAGSGITISTSDSGITGASGNFTVNPGALTQFAFNPIPSPQISSWSFTITVTAEDQYGNTVTNYSGAPTLSSAGSVSPSVMSPFVNGVEITSIAVATPGLGVTITAIDGSHTGVSNSFTVDPTISASSSGNGAISPDGTFSVSYGGSQTFILTPDPGYSVAEVAVNGVSVGAVNSYTFTNIQSSYNIYVGFSPASDTTPTSTPAPTATPTPSPSPTPTSSPAPSPTATPQTTGSSPTPTTATATTPSPSQNPLTVGGQTASQNVSQDAIFGAVAAVIVVAVVIVMFARGKMPKFEGNDDKTDDNEEEVVEPDDWDPMVDDET